MIEEIIRQLSSLATAIRALATPRVASKLVKESTINIAKSYFETLSDKLSDADPEKQNLDQNFQELVRLAHGRNAKTAYLNIIAQTNRLLVEQNIRKISRKTASSNSNLSGDEQKIVAILNGLNPVISLSYQQGILDLRGPDRLSYRGTATEFREALREVLASLAKDEDVTTAEGFALEKGHAKPTMAQKAKYILKMRGRKGNDIKASTKSLEAIEEITSKLTRTLYDAASVHTHIGTEKNEVVRLKRYLDAVLMDLLDI